MMFIKQEDQKLLVELAGLKSKIKEMEERAKAIQTRILDAYPVFDPYTVPDIGTLSMVTRRGEEVVDKQGLIARVSQPVFNIIAKISVKTLRDTLGSLTVDDMIDKGIIASKISSVYLQLRRG